MTVLIVGAGLSGLALADMLERRGKDYLLLEARDRVGGRVLTRCRDGQPFDLGPAWFWPGQPRMAALVDRLGLAVFEQYARGDLMFEDGQGRVQRGRGFASMAGSLRVAQGLGAVTAGLAEGLSPARLRTGVTVTGLRATGDGIVATVSDGEEVAARRAVLALPPRVAGRLGYSPDVQAPLRHWMSATPTWMAGQAKAVALYDRPFWRAAGLSGDASSRFGPMVEIHDASPAQGGLGALFGFIGTPPDARRDQGALKDAIAAQLVRLFGPEAAAPLDLWIKDWASDPQTATPADLAPLTAHPTYRRAPASPAPWEGRLHFAGTEVAPEFGGYLEGALEAAENVIDDL